MSSIDNPNLAPEPASPWPTITRYGIIGGLVLIVYSMIGILTGLSSPSAGFLALGVNVLLLLAIYTVLMVMAVKQQRDNFQGGYITFGRAFLVAFMVSLITGVISTLFSYVYLNIIDPGYLAKVAEDAQEFYERLNMTQEQIDAALKQTVDAGKPASMLRQVGVGTIFGAIISLIVGGIMKKSPEMTIQ